MGSLGIVACGSESGFEVAARVLRAGGSAADAAVGAALGMSAGDPAITSLAGGGAMIHRDAETGATEVLDFFCDAPGRGATAASEGREVDFQEIEIRFEAGGMTQRFRIGRGAAAVPGVLPGLGEALARWGRVDPSVVTAPVAEILRRGVRFTAYQEACLGVVGPICRFAPDGRRYFCREDGELLAEGDVYRNPELAATLDAWGADPAGAYAEVCERILAGFGVESGGWITAEDLASYRPVVRAPYVVDYGAAGARVSTNPAPSVGGRYVALTLALFERARLGETAPGESERWRRLAAVFRAIAEARALQPDLIDRADAAELAGRRLESALDGGAAGESAEPRTPGNTSHASVVDRAGNAAGVTLSHGEGCGYFATGTGLHLNNILGEEDLFPEGFLVFEPGERLATMMCPTIVESRGDVYVLGAGGSNRIRTAMAQVIAALCTDGAEPADAVARGRLHYEDGVLSAETWAIPGGAGAIERAAALAAETRSFEGPSLFFGGVHLAGIRRGGELVAAGDARRGGVAREVTS